MAASWVLEEMNSVDLEDKRLNARLWEVVDLLGQRPDKSIPTAVNGGHAETTAAYRLFDNSKASFEKILTPHVETSWERVSQQPRVILAQDTTELDLTRPQQQMKGAGLLDGNARYGEFLHPLMGFTPDGTPLGTLYAELWTRSDQKLKAQDSDQPSHKEIPIEDKESVRWLDAQREAQHIAREMPETQFISVADSEADIFEVLELKHEAPDNFSWVIRACQNRALVGPRTDEQGEDLPPQLYERVEQEPVRFVQPISVRGREPKINCETRGRRQPQQTRETEVEVRAAKIIFRAPWRPDRRLTHTGMNAVLVSERNPPAGEMSVEWMLLTNLPIDSDEAVRSVIQSYCVRWMIEVYFRTLKSGCQVEKLRFEELERFESCLAVYLIIAWRTLYTVRLGRDCPDLKCEAIFDPDEWKSVYRVVEKANPPSTPPPLQEMVRLVARLGGYINRSRADEPGPQTVALGMQRLHDITQCWRLFGPEAQRKTRGGTCV